jgi:cytochrome c peroxidase
MSEAKVSLGRFLFYDTRLSGNGQSSCASCHHQDKAFTDGRAQAIGSTGQRHPRNAQGLGNVAYNPTLTWARPTAESLESQMETPLFGMLPVEMGVNDSNRSQILQRLQADPGYPARFAAAFPGPDAISWPNIVKAIAAFERTLLSGNSYYDQAHKGRGAPLNDSQNRGANLFFTRANCFRCHGNFNFSDTVTYEGGPVPELRFHNTGLFNMGGTGAFPAPNRGIFEVTRQPGDMGRFRAPSLRNVAVTAPYMHDGSIATLEDVLDFYAAGGRHITSGPTAGDGRTNPFKSDIVNNLNLSAQDKADLIAFLRTLTDEEFLKNPRFSNPFPR